MMNKDAKQTLIFGGFFTLVSTLICLFLNKWAGIICLVLGILLSGVYFYNIKKRNDKINELNNYLSLMCSGNFELDIMDNTEGEMSILKNNLYKIMTLLKTQNDELKKDKIHLANSLADISHQLKTPLTFLFLRSICRNSKNNCSDTSSSWCSPCPSLKLIKYLIPLSVDSSRSVYALALYAIPFSSCQK